MASQRFALQRKLASLPQFPVTAETAAKLEDAIDAINRNYTGDVAETTLGPVIETSRGPVKMQLIMAEEGFSPLTARSLTVFDNSVIGQMGREGLVEALGGAGQIRDVSFNMVDPGGVPIFQYEPIREAGARKQIQAAGGYTQPMMEALYRLIAEQGMRPGDILKATPIGMHSPSGGGDMRRALTYMNQGFGVPDIESGQMYARIGQDGRIEPVQLFSPSPTIAERIGAQLDLRRLSPPKQLELDFNRAAMRGRMTPGDAAADRYFEATLAPGSGRPASYGMTDGGLDSSLDPAIFDLRSTAEQLDDDGDPGPLQGGNDFMQRLLRGDSPF